MNGIVGKRRKEMKIGLKMEEKSIKVKINGRIGEM